MYAAMCVLKLGNKERSSGPTVIYCSPIASSSSSCLIGAPSSLPSSKSYSGSSVFSTTSSIIRRRLLLEAVGLTLELVSLSIFETLEEECKTQKLH